ncbi:PiT family inorganic phosphate transporter [Roseibium hamelinense]|uniref:Phosphate transporter n=1 Tax=Roseibium hamelinense TaxID=150831 RepID=A0A562THG2_9HYPH|nr:inorganic phosphate transporter [Roseibium hamelinense]MTI46123.1 inorganic phosphate transporter [Roseibium hamelinense]TWI92684.1 PiT family inorganic phosphate transporter [Roseibium hamelinense]
MPSSEKAGYKGPALDKDLDKITFVGEAAESLGRRMLLPGLAIVFIALCAFVAAYDVVAVSLSDTLVIGAAAAIGGYMALNIGANDVANNVGPAVGAKALPLTTALILAAVFESAGALLAGSRVLETVSAEILPQHAVVDANMFMVAMMAALVSAAAWINIATWIGAPVSTTHSIVGGVVGAGIAAAGLASVNWETVGAITLSWVLSPVLGGLVAAGFLSFINRFITYKSDRIEAARFWLPILIGLLAGAFAAYVMVKAGDTLFSVRDTMILPLALVIALVVWLAYRPHLERASQGMDNKTQSLRKLFTVPLMCSAALLSFAHGANDIANAVGPLAAIVRVQSAHVDQLDPWALDVLTSSVPLWVSGVGAFGISAGLLLFGRRLIKVVGSKITKLNPIRAFCIALSAAITVLLASSLGMPVSSTHITVGAVFGVGFYREWYRSRYVLSASGADDGRGRPRYLRNREEHRRRRLVRRSYVFTIIGAWVVTVPATAVLSGVVFVLVRFAAL